MADRVDSSASTSGRTLVVRQNYGEAFLREAKEQIERAEDGVLPQKRVFRARAHVNPLSHNNMFDYPSAGPSAYDWKKHYPEDPEGHLGPDFADVGCGFGGLSVGLAPLFPKNRIAGFEIRDKVAEYVRLRIVALRKENPGAYQNVTVVRSNTMKYLVNFFRKGQLSKMFICFPDPHFKTKNHRRRIITPALLDEYAYAIRPGGILYTITDVKELHEWMDRHSREHPFFEKMSDEELKNDAALKVVINDTEEGKKVARNKGDKFVAVFRRLPDEVVRAAWKWTWDESA